jgi:hypothetical protein
MSTPTPFAVPHFTTGAFAAHCTRLCDDVYAQVLDNVTKCCCDVIIADARGRLLLGRRCVRARTHARTLAFDRALPKLHEYSLAYYFINFNLSGMHDKY